MSVLVTAPKSPLPPRLCMAVLGSRDILATVIRVGCMDLPSISCLARTCSRLRVVCKEASVHYRAMVTVTLSAPSLRTCYCTPIVAVAEAIKGVPSTDALDYVLGYLRSHENESEVSCALLATVYADPSRAETLCAFAEQNSRPQTLTSRVFDQFFGSMPVLDMLIASTPHSEETRPFTRHFYTECVSVVATVLLSRAMFDEVTREVTWSVIRRLMQLGRNGGMVQQIGMAMHRGHWDFVEVLGQAIRPSDMVTVAALSDNIEAMRRYIVPEDVTDRDVGNVLRMIRHPVYSKTLITYLIETYGEEMVVAHGEIMYESDQYFNSFDAHWKDEYTKGWWLDPLEAANAIVIARTTLKSWGDYRIDYDARDLLYSLARRCFAGRERLDPHAVPVGCYSYKIPGDDRTFFHKIVGRGDDSQNPHFMDGSGHPRYFKIHTLPFNDGAEPASKKQKQ